MSIVTNTDWTLMVEDHGYCTVRQYRTKIEVRGDEGYHRGTEQVGYLRTHINDLPRVIVERGIVEFSREDDMRLACSMPVEPGADHGEAEPGPVTGKQADLILAVVRDWQEKVDEEDQMVLLRAMLPPRPEEEGEEAYERLLAGWAEALEALIALAQKA